MANGQPSSPASSGAGTPTSASYPVRGAAAMPTNSNSQQPRSGVVLTMEYTEGVNVVPDDSEVKKQQEIGSSVSEAVTTPTGVGDPVAITVKVGSSQPLTKQEPTNGVYGAMGLSIVLRAFQAAAVSGPAVGLLSAGAVSPVQFFAVVAVALLTLQTVGTLSERYLRKIPALAPNENDSFLVAAAKEFSIAYITGGIQIALAPPAMAVAEALVPPDKRAVSSVVATLLGRYDFISFVIGVKMTALASLVLLHRYLKNHIPNLDYYVGSAEYFSNVSATMVEIAAILAYPSIMGQVAAVQPVANAFSTAVAMVLSAVILQGFSKNSGFVLDAAGALLAAVASGLAATGSAVASGAAYVGSAFTFARNAERSPDYYPLNGDPVDGRKQLPNAFPVDFSMVNMKEQAPAAAPAP